MKAQDQPRSDSLFTPKDSLIAYDTLKIRFIPAMGSLVGSIDSTGMFHRSQFMWTDARYLGDLLWRAPGFFFRELGEAGKPNQLNAFGIENAGIAILLDGRPMNDPVTGTYNLYEIPLEFIEQVEILDRSDGILFGGGTTKAALNFVTRQYNAIRPMTKIRYVQASPENILTDGLFTQNLARAANLTLGFQRHVSNGRYRNASLDSWNVRARVRYNVSDRFNISLMEFYTKTINGMNGGVDLSAPTPVFDNVSATVKDTASERVKRHDVTLSMIGRLFEDSLSTTRLSLYYSSLESEYNEESASYQNARTSFFRGIRFSQTFDRGNVFLGFDVQEIHIDSSRYVTGRYEPMSAFFGKIRKSLWNLLTPSFFARFESRRSKPFLSIGSDVELTLGQSISFFAGVRLSGPIESKPVELTSSDSSILQLGSVSREKHEFVEGGLRFSPDESFTFSLTGFRRITKEALVYRFSGPAPNYPNISIFNISEAKSEGVAGSASLRWGNIEAYGVLTYLRYTEGDTVKTLIPQVVLSSELAYRDKFFNDALDARFGIRSRFMSQHWGKEYVPRQGLFVENIRTQPGQFSTMDLFAVLHIGDAFISVTWENLLNANYFITPVYPMPGRNFKLGVNWVFVD